MLGALGAGAYVIADLIHEVIGHAGMCWLQGGSVSLLTSTYFKCNLNNLMVNIGGPVANILAGILFGLAFITFTRASGRTRLFLLLAMALNLFWGFGGMIYSGLLNVDDWSYLIDRLQPSWLWRSALVVGGIYLYRTSLRIIAKMMPSIPTSDSGDYSGERRRLILIPYLAAGIAACIAASFDVMGPLMAIREAALETFAASAGFLLISGMPAKAHSENISVKEVITPDSTWFASIAVIYILFIMLMGHGIKV